MSQLDSSSELTGRERRRLYACQPYIDTESVHLSSMGAVAWSDEIELCPDALYMQLTGTTVKV